MNTEDKTTENAVDFDRTLRIMEVVENELDRQNKDSLFSLFVFLCAENLWIILVALWDMLGKPILEEYLTIGVEAIAALMFVVILKFTRLDIHKMGVTKKNLKPTLKRAGIISAAAVVIMLAIKLLTQRGQPFIYWELYDALYPFTAVLQEFLARGFLVTTLVSINPTKNRKHIAVVCSSLLFASLHLYYGFFFMVGAGLLSVLLGYCYLKDENIWGVSIIHFVIGTVGVMLGIV